MRIKYCSNRIGNVFEIGSVKDGFLGDGETETTKKKIKTKEKKQSVLCCNFAMFERKKEKNFSWRAADTMRIDKQAVPNLSIQLWGRFDLSAVTIALSFFLFLCPPN